MVLGAQDILESPDEPEPVSADDSGPVVVQEGVIPGPGVGDEDQGDRDNEAVVGDADEKEIATGSGLEDVAQPVIEEPDDFCGPPSSPIVLQPDDGEPTFLSSGQQLDLSTDTTQTTEDSHSATRQILEQHTEASPPPQVEDEQARPLTPDIVEEPQIGSSVELPPSLIESQMPGSLVASSPLHQDPEESQQVDELIADSSNTEEPTVEEPSVEQPSVEEASVEKPSVEEPIVEEPTIEQSTVEEPTVEQPSVDSPTLGASTVDQPSLELEMDSQSAENVLDRQQEQEDELVPPEMPQETSLNLEPSTTDQARSESELSIAEAPLSQSRGSEDLQKDDNGPDSEQLDEFENVQVTDNVVSDQASDLEDVQPGLSLEQSGLEEPVSQTQQPESSLVTEPAQSPGESAHIASGIPLDQAENESAALPSSTSSNLDLSNNVELTISPPVDTPCDAIDTQNQSHQLESGQALGEMSGSGMTDISDDLDRDLLGGELSQNEQDPLGPSLESSDVLPIDEQSSTGTGPLDNSSPQNVDGLEATSQGEIDDSNDPPIVSSNISLEELPPDTTDQGPSTDDLSQPQPETVVNEEVVLDQDLKDDQAAGSVEAASPPGSSTPILESPPQITDLEQDQGQDEGSEGNQEVMNSNDQDETRPGDFGDDSQPKSDHETSPILEQEPVIPSQEQDRDISSSTEDDTLPGASFQETIAQPEDDVESVIEPELHISSSGHNSGQSTPKQLPLPSEVEATSHDLEGQEMPSSPTDHSGDHNELAKEPDSAVDQDEPQQDDIADLEQPFAETANEPHGDRLSGDQIVLEESGTDEHGSKKEDSTQEAATQNSVSEELEQPSEVPLEPSIDPIIDGKRSTESLSHQPTEQISRDDDDVKIAEAAVASAVAAGVVAAGIAGHELVSSKGDIGGGSVAVSESTDDIQRPRTADKATGTVEESAPDKNDPEVRSVSSAAPDSPEEVSSQQPLSESFTIVDPPSSTEQGQVILDSSEKPVPLSRRDSSTQTDDLWRPKTPLARESTPGIELPDPNDEWAIGRSRSRARSARRMSKQSVQQAEEVVAAAVIIRAAADTLGETSDRMAVHVKDLKQHGETTAPSNLQIDGRGTRVADTSIPYDFIADPIAGKESSKTDDKLPRSPRSRDHRASHSSRSSRPSTREDGTTRSSHHRHSSHRHRADGEREPEQAPSTPPRHRDTAESAHGSHSSRSRRERTPQEQAEHERRKEERRLAREKDKAKSDSPIAEPKGKEVEAPPSADRSHRSSRRHSSTRHSVASPSNTARTEASTAAPSKKFFDMKNGQSVMGSSFGGPLTADTDSTTTKDKDTISSSRRSKEVSRPPPVELKRSSTTRSSRGVRRSLDQSNAKLQKARREESTKAAKESQPRRADSSSPVPADAKKAKDDDKHRKSRLERRQTEDKDEKKKSSGGLKGMFKRLFSS